MDLAHIVSVVSSFIGIFFMLMTYTYIDKLDKIGCACAESQYKSYIKGYSLFLVFYMFLTMLLPPSVVTETFGSVGTMIYLVIRPLVSIASIIFLIIAALYVRRLINEKCECSADVRREILYIYYIVEIILISFALLLVILESVVMGALILSLKTVSQLDNKTVINTIANPIKEGKKLPKNIKKISASLKKTLSRR